MPLVLQGMLSKQSHKRTRSASYNSLTPHPHQIFLVLCIKKRLQEQNCQLINIICNDLLTYEFRKDMRVFCFCFLCCFTAINMWHTYFIRVFIRKRVWLVKIQQIMLRILFVDVLWINKRACLLTKRQFQVQYKKQTTQCHHYGRHS